ncbi:MAG: MFS transporter [Bacteroidia bacterium]|nr:MFS transporter [Bacteroidia bacterium]
MSQSNKKLYSIIVVASLGYFVDIYDLTVFNIVKNDSLHALGYSGDSLKSHEIYLFNMQMIGMLIGGLIWGILGDKKGRLSVLFGSIFLYSIANIFNAFVTDINTYAFWRFVAGLGLAGELGAGITLVTETMKTEKRGYGTMIIVTFGALGAVAAGLIGKSFGWQATYITGGCMGLALLLLRASTFESGMFKSIEEKKEIKKGNFFMLFQNKSTFFKYLACIGIGLPVWFVVGVLINLSNRFAAYYNVDVSVADCVMFAYLGLSIGDLASGLMSQLLRSRKKVVLLYILTCTILSSLFLYYPASSATYYKIMSLLLGTATGYWALFVTIASEQFGTNIRSTVTTTVPNFVRGAVVPITLSFKYLSLHFGINESAAIVGLVCCLIAAFSTWYVSETFSKDMNYNEA